MYSRARIIDKIDNEYNVFYLDYGNTEVVASEDIFELPNDLKEEVCVILYLLYYSQSVFGTFILKYNAFTFTFIRV